VRPFIELVDEIVAREDAGEARFFLPAQPDPFVLAAALAAQTSRIRLVVEVDTARTHPYLVARKLAAVDKISRGRVEWVATDTDPDRRAEAIDIVTAMLTSWLPGALVNDKAAGIHVDTDRVVTVHRDGAHYAVHSPLDVCAGPQGVVPLVEGR
jgi:alkanesulfonate monooxygenase SsuD/methylene tetrahydromethanopterin reductase-like flavin-dependent oxidoreductase (luciferase family)